ncbi:FHA domain-containing protein [Eubacterium ruminantium]|nr:FHA domain-containing protein [Eubacterium ruminantium]
MSSKTVLIINDAGQNKTVDLDSFGKNTLVIGRSHDCDILLTGAKVSGHHGCFFQENGEWAYQDLNSTNGSLVNGNRIIRSNLADRMKLTLGFQGDPMSVTIDVQINSESTVQHEQQSVIQYGQANAGYASAGLIEYGQPNVNGYPPTGVNGYGQNDTNGYPPAGVNGYGQSGTNGYPQGGMNGYPPIGSGPYGQSGYSGNAFVFMVISGILWSVIGILCFIDFVKSAEILGYVGELFQSTYGVIIFFIFVSYVLMTIGAIVLPIALFMGNKKGQSTGSQLFSGGVIGVFLLIIGMVMIAVGELGEIGFKVLFSSSYTVLLLIEVIFEIACVSMLASNFKRHYKGEKIYGRWVAPIVCQAVTVLLVIIMISSIKGKYNSYFDEDISLFEALPIGKIWVAIVWVGAIIFSSVYLHMDDNSQGQGGYRGGNYSSYQPPYNY